MSETDSFSAALESMTQFQAAALGQCLSITQHASNIVKEQLFNKPLQLADATMNFGLNTQSAFVRSFIKDLENESGETAPVNQWIRQGVANVELWSDAQKQAWNMWMDTIRSLESMHSTGEYVEQTNNQLRVFRDMTRKTSSMHTEWFLRLLQGMEDAGSETIQEGTASPRPVADVEQAKNAA